VLKVPFEKKRSVFILSLCYSLASNALLIALPVAAEQLIANKQMNVLDGKVVKNNPVGGAKIEQDTIKVETTTPSASVAISEPDVRLPNKQPKIVVSPENTTGKEAALLERIKEQKQLENNLKLVPTERKVNDAVVKSAKRNVKSLPENTIINKLEFNQANMLDVARALADISGLNFVATEEASKKNVTVFLQNISVINALEAITKNSGLWYRKDKDSGTYRIMSTQEYQRDLVVYREDTTKVFNLLHPNPIIVATAIRDLYGDRVILSFGAEDETRMPTLTGNGGTLSATSTTTISSSRRNAGRRNGTNSTTITNQSVSYPGGRSSNSDKSTNILRDDLTPDQLEKLGDTLAERGDIYSLSSEALKGINNKEQPIYITLNREHDLMIVRTSDNAVINDIEQLVKEMDRPTKQVLLEMKILSLDVGDAYRQSMDLDYMPSDQTLQGPLTDQTKNPLGTIAPINVTNTTTVDDGNGNTSTQTQNGVINLGVRNILGLGNYALEGGTFVYQFMSDKIRARIQLLQENNRINTLSTPILLSSNNKPARVFVGTEQVVTTGFEAVAGASNGLVVTTPAITPITDIRNIGNTLQVMPKINADKTVTLLIQQDSSTLIKGASTIPIPVGSSIQSFNVDSVKTSNLQGTVVAKDGLTIAIGGLIDSSDSEEEQKVPLLGDFPILGELFKRKVKQNSKRELLLLITPHIIESAHDGEDLTRDAVEPLSEQEW
jgi:type II secretory pathway component GspD/PulD (secretin)